MKKLLPVGLLVCVAGCVVQDGRSSPEPIWWPTPVVRASTLSSSHGRLEIGFADPILPPLSANAPEGRQFDPQVK